MPDQRSRHRAPAATSAAEGWTVARLTPQSRLFGANGLRTGPDGRIYVAQVSGSQISAINVATGDIEAVSPMGGAIVAPDDLAFDEAGNLYATEITEGRVSVRKPNGDTRVLNGEMPVSNPITFHQGRLIAGECRPGGRIMELDRDSGKARMILDNVPMPNAFAVGPDGKLYFPVMGTNEIWRISLDGGAPETVATGLGVPDSVKFDSKGRIVSTQVASGEVLRIDPANGERTVLAKLTPGLDNVTFVGERIFVSNISGYVVEVLEDQKTRELVPDGFNWPLGLAVDGTGLIYIADGPFSYTLRPGQTRHCVGMLFTPGYPGYARGVAASGPGEFIVTTATGDVSRYLPAQQSSSVLAKGLNELYGVAVGPGGLIVAAEQGSGRIVSIRAGQVEELAKGLIKPSGVAFGSDGQCYVTDSGAGKVLRLLTGRVETVIDGLQTPQGICAVGNELFVVDAGAKELLAIDVVGAKRTTIASRLPVGAPAGVTPKRLGAIGTMSGPMGPFAGVAADAEGALYLSADADGSLLCLRRSKH
jgi:sugar lactone lactonase YvrE